MNTQALVTVYIPTYNRLDLLQRAVKSVQAQTYKNLEIIIVDDCSTDGTQEYLSQLANEDARVRYFIKEKNSGACISRNIAIQNAKGEFITGLDDDDYFLEERVDIFLKNWQDLYAGLCSYTYIKSTPKMVKTNKRSALKNYISADDLLKANHIGNQVFTKTVYLQSILGFDAHMQVWQDLECWYRLLNKYGSIKRVEIPLYVVDISHPHERISNKKIQKINDSFEYFCKKHNLNSEQQKDLSTHILSYNDINNLSLYWRRFTNFKTIGNFYLVLCKLLRV